jgi:hypothetical protein
VWDANFNYIEADGRNIDSYSTAVYANRDEWNAVAQLSSTDLQVNRGDVPAPFIWKGVSDSAHVSKFAISNIGGENGGSGTWNSLAGVVTDNNGKAMYYEGNARGYIEPNETAPEGVEFKYWYY